MNSGPGINAGNQVQTGAARYLYLPAAVAAIGGLLFGFDTAVINGAIVFLKSQFSMSDSQTEVRRQQPSAGMRHWRQPGRPHQRPFWKEACPTRRRGVVHDFLSGSSFAP